MLSSYFIYVSAINILVGGFNPSEKYESVGMIIQFPTVSGKSFKIPWFQSPPIRY
jgi:hypothetical protein